MRRSKTVAFELALSGVSTALSLICTVLYYYSPFAKLSFLALAAVALTLPLTVDKVRSAALAYAATAGLTIAVAGPLAALPFVFIFGWQPVVMGACTRYLPKKPYLSIPLKVALFNAGLYGTYTLYGLGDSVTNALARLGWDPAYWVIAILASLVFVAYDYAMQWVYRWIARRLMKVTAKYKVTPLERAQATTDGTQNEDTLPTEADIFGESLSDPNGVDAGGAAKATVSQIDSEPQSPAVDEQGVVDETQNGTPSAPDDGDKPTPSEE